MDPYRTPAEKQRTPMNEHERDALVTKYLVMGVLTLACLAAGTCSYTSHDEHAASVEVARQKTEEAKAERDRAMFDSMSKAAPAASH